LAELLKYYGSMAKASTGTIRIGVGGWTYEPWRGAFYPPDLPQKRELEYSSRHLTSIEINGTFYGSQKPESFAKWHDETPPDFVFSVKAPRYATHRKVLADAGGSVERFFSSGVANLKDKLGPVNWQLPPFKKFEPEDFAAFLALLPRELEGRPLRHAIEARHASFCCADFVAMARERGVAVVLAGDSQYPRIEDPTAAFVYARIMGTREGPELGYPAEELDHWAARARAWAAEPRDVYLYVISGHKVRNPAAAKALIERVGTERVGTERAAPEGVTPERPATKRVATKRRVQAASRPSR
jgi:uncharacterized protein YecE (DUF72 family)